LSPVVRTIDLGTSPVENCWLSCRFLAKTKVALYSFQLKTESCLSPYKAPKNLIHSAFPRGDCSVQSPLNITFKPLFVKYSKRGCFV
jgi:hypothetical protein